MTKLPLISVSLMLLGTPVLAQEVTAVPLQRQTTPNRALEITLGAGYAQGFGDIGQNQRSLADISGAGGEITLGVGYRIDPNWMVGVYGSGSKHATGDFSNGDIWSATAGLQANYHFLPENSWDPWIGLASGWRGHWVNHAGDAGTDSRHGWDVARVTAGMDLRVLPELAIAPYAGVGVTTFLSQEIAGQTSFSNVSSPSANVWVSAGIQGRFDFFSKSGPSVALASN